MQQKTKQVYFNKWSHGLVTRYMPECKILPFTFFKKNLDAGIKKNKKTCVRCGCFVGNDKMEKELFNYNGFFVCSHCLNTKLSGNKNNPDLEELTNEDAIIIKEKSLFVSNL